MSATLTADDFPAFFEAVHGHLPFPWQARLVRELAAQAGGRWPDLLDLPTGSGKTATIDAAVFLLALQADRGEARRAPLRIAFVVDRRLVVDDAFDRAEKLAKALADRDADEVVRAVAARLKRLAGPRRPPLVVAKLRGGAPREDDWARTPCQPTVLCSTVDQVGSRLLFRGYGVGDRMKPVHAGLLGSDALILLDEAHLSEPFRQTAKDIADLKPLHGPDPRPLHVALLTATPGAQPADAWRFPLLEEDREHPILYRRLNAAKPARAEEAKGDEAGRSEKLAHQAKTLFDALQRTGQVPVVGVVANRIARARGAFECLNALLGDSADVRLIIGRARAVDREGLAEKLGPIKTGVTARPTRPLVVVATQTIEAGVDIDLDGLVTEAASLDALRQRFGRLNRDGRDIEARSVVVWHKDDRNPKRPDPVYGEAIAATLATLYPDGVSEVDFGVSAMSERLAALPPETVQSMLAGTPDAPVLMPAYVDLWSQTAPVPACDPAPALFLHGPKRQPAAVQVVWRADVAELIAAGDDTRLRTLMALAPPRSAEALELPLHAARAWLANRTPDLADVADQTSFGEEEGRSRPAFRWRGAGDDRSQVIDGRALRPGDLIVVPSAYGGCDEYGWNPGSKSWTSDAAVAAAEPYVARRFVVRVAPGLIRQAFAGDDLRDGQALDEAAARIAARVVAALNDLGARPSAQDVALALTPIVPAPIRDDLERLLTRGRGLERPAFPYGLDEADRSGVVLTAARGLEPDVPPSADGSGADDSSTEDDDAGSFVGEALPLVDHSRHVERFAAAFARRAGLSDALVADLALAGWLHDAGKADPRFQALLSADRGFFAREEATSRGEAGVLAKSAEWRSSPGAPARAGLPPGWRHEALSVRLALENPRLDEAHDRGLVLWLVGTHHGLGRPFFDFRDPTSECPVDLARVAGLSDRPPPRGDGPERLGFAIPECERFAPTARDPEDLRGLDWPSLFRDLRRRYGPWGLARLEATLRLADHRASEAARDGVADEEDAA
jgi:CRISPR-associated endonuclease/helicase Cas3